MSFVAIKNRTTEPRVIMHDSKSVEVPAKGTVIVEEAQGLHGASQMLYRHDPLTNVLQAVRLFEIVPLEEAIKAGAKLPESPAVAAERKRLAADKEAKKALLAELKEELRKDGWKPPKGEKGE